MFGSQCCFGIIFGHGTTGLWLTNQLIGVTPGTTSVKEPPLIDGIPGPQGTATSSANNSTNSGSGTPEIPDLEAMNILLSPQIEQLADWVIPFPVGNRSDLPLFWQVPKSGGTAVQRILGQCMGLVEVSQAGKGHDEPVRYSFIHSFKRHKTSLSHFLLPLSSYKQSLQNFQTPMRLDI